MSPDTSDGYRAPFVTGWSDPATPTGSDAETEPIHRDARPIYQRYDKWRLYYRAGKWFAYQPEHVDLPMFPAHDDFARVHVGGSYGYWSDHGAEALHMLQLAMAKAAA